MLRLVLAACLAGALFAVPAASAATPTQILRDCEDDSVLQGDYSSEDLRRALRNIPTDLDQYTNCRDVLARASADEVSGGGGGGGGSAGGKGAGGKGPRALLQPETDEDRKALSETAAAGARSQDVGGEQIVPGAAGFAADAARNGLPGSLLALLVLLAVAAAAAAAPQARRLGPRIRERVLRRG
jgi:hypothetical protein